LSIGAMVENPRSFRSRPRRWELLDNSDAGHYAD
jgi:hypothetical protein